MIGEKLRAVGREPHRCESNGAFELAVER